MISQLYIRYPCAPWQPPDCRISPLRRRLRRDQEGTEQESFKAMGYRETLCNVSMNIFLIKESLMNRSELCLLYLTLLGLTKLREDKSDRHW